MQTLLLPVELSEKTRQKLESIRHSRSQPHSLVQRAEIVLLAVDGWPNQAIANALEISPSTVVRWCRRFEEQGLEGIGFCDEVHPAGKPSPSHSGSDGTKLNGTIECLLKLRSVRDQFADAGLDRSSGELAEKLAVLEDHLVDHLAAQREHRDGVGLLTVAVVGDFNSGKSTFINALLGKDLCPVGDAPTTSSVTHFIHGDEERIEQQLSDGKRKPLKKSEYRSLVQHDKMGDREPYVFHISVNASILEHIRLVDTPGFNAPPPNSHDTRVTENAITGADALFVLMDTRKGNPTKSLLKQLDRLQQSMEDESSPPMFLLLNKAEELPPTQRTEVKSECKARNGDRFRDITLISAKWLLKDSDDAAPLDALQTATRQIRDAIMRRDTFEALISAKVSAETGTAIYRMDINGNVYEAPASSDSGLASREQLYEMVRSVSAERHVLLERQFQRKTTQLQKEWQQTVSELDKVLKKELRESHGGGDGTDDIKSKALKEIDNAKSRIIDRIHEIFEDTVDGIVTVSKRKGKGMITDLIERTLPVPVPVRFPREKGRILDSTFYQIHVCLDKMYNVADDHDHWNHISHIYKNLLLLLKKQTGVSSVLPESKFARKLKVKFLKFIRDFQEEDKEDSQEREEWQFYQNYWQFETEDEQERDRYYERLSSHYQSQVDQWILTFSQEVIQPQIDQVQAAVISAVERNLSSFQERAEELDKLQQRINELKEHTP